MEMATHRMSKTRPYKIYWAARSRCTSRKYIEYQHYGGRGIKFCDRWMESFENFWEDMKEGYADNLTIERINNDGNYCKENCKWATYKEQARNKSIYKDGIQIGYMTPKSSNRFFKGNLTEFLKGKNIKWDIFYYRIAKKGMSIEEALKMPVKKYNFKNGKFYVR